jgi:ribonuclease P protein component
MASPRRGRRGRLSRSGEFERVYRDGSSHANRFVVAYAFARGLEEAAEPRLGVSVGRKLGGAVDRNAVKRALRDAFWELAERLPEDHDFVLVARPALPELIEREGADGVLGAVRETLAKAVGEDEERLS